MKIELENLPALETLELDLFQKFDLTLRDLASLKTIQELDFEWSARIPRGGKAPGKLWVGRLDIDGLPAIEELFVFAPGLEYYRTVNTPNFQFVGIGAYYRTFSNQRYAAELSPQAAKALINGLGQSEGPQVVDLDAVPLADVDLSPLCGNHQLTQLKLSQSETTLEQWKQLKPMTWLTKFTIQGNNGSAKAVPWVLDNFPHLEHFAFSPTTSSGQLFATSTMVRLEVVDRPELISIDMGDMTTSFFSVIRIVDSPKLTLPVKASNLSLLELVNSGSLTGLSVNGTFPENARLQGLRDLQFFAVGGKGVTDEVIGAIAKCSDLKTLTLAYPSVTQDGLKVIQQLGSLTSLSLPGTPLSDEIVAQWPDFPMMTHLDLSDTKITAKSVRKLAGSRGVERISLDRTEMNPTDFQFMGQFPYFEIPVALGGRHRCEIALSHFRWGVIIRIGSVGFRCVTRSFRRDRRKGAITRIFDAAEQ